ncbi:MAG: threonine ammonia-lyase [Armatimonas sp.]
MVTLKDIEDAYTLRVRPEVRRTPLYTSDSVSAAAHCSELHMKMENLQGTGSFKLRGATNRIGLLTDAERASGVITASAGNHAQGVALAARQAGVPATVYMPKAASLAKIQATEGYGAEVILEGANFDEAVAAAKARSVQTGQVFISAYDDDSIIAGQGSVGLEILEDLPDLDTVVVPIGGGGLFSGIAIAIKALRPSCRVIGVQAAGADGAAQSFKAGQLLPRQAPCDTIADGIAIKGPSERTFHYIKTLADDVVTVDDATIADAILLLLTRMKVLVEPSGAAGLAALMAHPGLGQGKTAVVLCGGNIDIKLLSDLIERGMVRLGRYVHLFTTCPDRPGGLAALLDTVASAGGNIMEVTHNRISPSVPYGRTGVELLIEVRGASHAEALKAHLEQRGYVAHPPE